MARAFLPEDPKQRLRLKRNFAALAATFIYTVVCLVLMQMGYFRITLEELYYLILVYWSGNLCFTVIIRSGLNMRLPDPSLTLVQMYWQIPFMLYTVYALNDLRSIPSLAFFALLSFGSFRLSSKQYIVLTMLTLISYGLILFALHHYHPQHLDVDKEVIYYCGFVITSMLLLYTGTAASQLREKNRQQNIKLTRALQENRKLATTDDLTGLMTRRNFMDILGKQKAWSERDGSDFVIVFADLDHFKHINDNFGHHTGDIVLQTFSDILRRSIREIDYAARFGGEEFVILLNSTDIDQARTIAERIRSSIEDYNFNDLAPSLNVTVSMGLANFRNFNSIQETLMCADNRMYKAKESGRNMVIYDN